MHDSEGGAGARGARGPGEATAAQHGRSAPASDWLVSGRFAAFDRDLRPVAAGERFDVIP
ncbi:hypothetical protein SAMN05216266_115118 [Amycolatopsis marina]|uniref:Uncharacterized protein n=1 Tax=Amycolatopsis marina TaxID=490629 RepID=A0A1I1BT04_9PSEU|nr:hypothetical protein [Amycolatopsis marina]SFB51570.1 hypothetical protein SAMN05216266_115118 [Amycolatopsis marina]